MACTLQATSKQVEIHNRLLRPCVSFLYAKHHSEMNATSAIIAARDLVRPPLGEKSEEGGVTGNLIARK